MSRSKLDVAVNVAILITCVIASVVLVRREFFPPPPVGFPGGIAAGEHSDTLRGAMPAGAERALFLAIAPNCHFCNESMDFYKQLVAHRDTTGSPVKVLVAVASPDAQAPEQTHLTAAGVKVDGMVQIDFAKTKVSGTPTLMLVDRQGKVLSVWVGKLDSTGQDQVLKAL
jgi:thioredoxin-related protein